MTARFHVNITRLLLLAFAFTFLGSGILHHHIGVLHDHDSLAFESQDQHPPTTCLTCHIHSDLKLNLSSAHLSLPNQAALEIWEEPDRTEKEETTTPLRAPPVV